MARRIWKPDPLASFTRRLGMSPRGTMADGQDPTGDENTCPDIWELSNGDVAVIGKDLTNSYLSRLPDDVRVGSDERLIVLPRGMVIAAKADIPDA